ncbi:hypothetical protein KAT24_01585 [Candidatus Pacearchaeota archaeon]|nr:hypothetical protein [Candidatus Pacearchaeota archaeon]
MLLEELAKKKTLNIDFHNHLQTGSEFRKKPKTFKEKISNLFLEEGFSDLTGILDKVMETELDILYVTNYEDQRYEIWTSEEQLQKAVNAGYEIEQGNYFTFFKKADEVKALGKSQEIPTSQGHVLLSGMRRNKNISSSKSLDETLAEAYDNELKIADHPYVIIEKSGTLRRSKNPEQDARKFDSLEQNGNFSFFSFPFSIANYLVKKASKKYQIPLVSNSDGHHPKDIGKTYNILDSQNLDYSSERAFRDSINYEIREGNFATRFTPIPPWRVFHHALMMGVYMIRDLYRRVFKK